MRTAIVIVHTSDRRCVDVEVPLDITAEQLIRALHEGLDPEGKCPFSLRCENPYAYLTGYGKLSGYGFHNGTGIYYTEE